MTMEPGIIGQRFGKLVVVAEAPQPENRRTSGPYYLCKCDCGGEKVVAKKLLLQGSTRSCGCMRDDHLDKVRYHVPPMHKSYNLDDLTGRRFGRLVAVKYTGRHYGDTMWICKCGCGQEITTSRSQLIRGRVVDCGCLTKAEQAAMRQKVKSELRSRTIRKYAERAEYTPKTSPKP